MRSTSCCCGIAGVGERILAFGHGELRIYPFLYLAELLRLYTRRSGTLWIWTYKLDCITRILQSGLLLNIKCELSAP